jgi:hypothetical protein
MGDPKGRHARPRRGKPTVATRQTTPVDIVSVSAAALDSTSCKWCNDDLEHCHDSWVRHTSGDRHCMNPLCVIPPEAHHMAIACNEFGCACVASGPAAAATVWAEMRQALLA